MSSWSLDTSKTGESTKCLWVGVMGYHPYPRVFYTLQSFTRIKKPRWRRGRLNDRHLQSNRKIGDCERSNREGWGLCQRLACLNLSMFLNFRYFFITCKHINISDKVNYILCEQDCFIFKTSLAILKFLNKILNSWPFYSLINKKTAEVLEGNNHAGRAFALVLCPHPGAFRQFMCPHPQVFAHFF